MKFLENRNSLDISLLPIRFQDDFLLLDKFLPLIQLSGEVLPHLPEIIGLDSPCKLSVISFELKMNCVVVVDLSLRWVLRLFKI